MALTAWYNPWVDDPFWPSARPARFFEDLSRMIRSFDDMYRGMPAQMNMPMNELSMCGNAAEVVNNDNKFQVSLDVKHFKPEELTVKTTDNRLVITGKHEEKQDEHGFVKREFSRSYYLPQGVKPEQFVSNLSPDGKLVITAPKHAIEGSNERKIPITAAPAAQKR
uniref:Small heat shock protein n=1 Tax=Trichinella pseudospiralis TaxID=6337 RepID=Q000T2_TRIPS|nr:small heat shock protein [Trichinella pseudospiralis]